MGGRVVSRQKHPGKPLSALESFASALGWRSLRVYHDTIPADETRAEPQLVTWYESGRAGGTGRQFALHINEYPIGNVQTYCAAVYAIRFRIFTHFHEFQLTQNLEFDPGEARRLEPLLHRRWFRSLSTRRRYRKLHPDCVDWTWDRFTTEPPIVHLRNE